MYKTATLASTAMSKVYGLMGLGLLLSFVIAYMVGTSPEALQAIFGTALKWPVILAPLALILIMSFGRDSMSANTLGILFGLFSALQGLSLAVIFVKYPGATIAGTLITTSLLFGAMSAWGYFTGKDLSHLGTFFLMALIGLIIAMVVNIFMQSSVFALIISVIGVFLFLGLTAYDTQQIKNDLATGYDTDKTIVMGAVSLYLDFLNLFNFLLNIFGNDD